MSLILLQGHYDMCEFYLGVHKPAWLWRTWENGSVPFAAPPGFKVDVPLFISRVQLSQLVKLAPAHTDWVLDSGGFSELDRRHEYSFTVKEYAAECRRYHQEIGRLRWHPTMDYMCEAHILKNTGLTVAQHQSLTIGNFLQLRDLEPDLPWCPVLQGFTRDEYLQCLDAYLLCGVDLFSEPIVGLGSICRREGTKEVEALIRELSGYGLRLHAFGLKTQGLRNVADRLTSADSMAWSFGARYEEPMEGHPHRNCANCPTYAVEWYWRMRGIIEGQEERASTAQLSLPTLG